jgi:hypothetical protein
MVLLKAADCSGDEEDGQAGQQQGGDEIYKMIPRFSVSGGSGKCEEKKLKDICVALPFAEVMDPSVHHRCMLFLQTLNRGRPAG